MDFDVVDGGSVVLLIPNTPEAESWVAENLPEDAPTLGKGIGVERRYIGAILNGLTEDGLTF
jgi:hypothetical protein